jgi:hypothetical protein
MNMTKPLGLCRDRINNNAKLGNNYATNKEEMGTG